MCATAHHDHVRIIASVCLTRMSARAHMGGRARRCGRLRLARRGQRLRWLRRAVDTRPSSTLLPFNRLLVLRVRPPRPISSLCFARSCSFSLYSLSRTRTHTHECARSRAHGTVCRATAVGKDTAWCTSAPGLGSPLPTSLRRDWARPCPHLHEHWAHPMHRDWAHPCRHLHEH